jgi:hypothetical protein
VLPVLFGSGCSHSIPLLVAEHYDPDVSYAKNVVVGTIDATGREIKLNEEGRALGMGQAAVLNAFMPAYRAVLDSPLLKKKATHVRRVVLDARQRTLQLELRNSDPVVVLYNAVRPDDASADKKFVTSAEGIFEIEDGIWISVDHRH